MANYLTQVGEKLKSLVALASTMMLELQPFLTLISVLTLNHWALKFTILVNSVWTALDYIGASMARLKLQDTLRQALKLHLVKIRLSYLTLPLTSLIILCTNLNFGQVIPMDQRLTLLPQMIL